VVFFRIWNGKSELIRIFLKISANIFEVSPQIRWEILAKVLWFVLQALEPLTNYFKIVVVNISIYLDILYSLEIRFNTTIVFSVYSEGINSVFKFSGFKGITTDEKFHTYSYDCDLRFRYGCACGMLKQADTGSAVGCAFLSSHRPPATAVGDRTLRSYDPSHIGNDVDLVIIGNAVSAITWKSGSFWSAK